MGHPSEAIVGHTSRSHLVAATEMNIDCGEGDVCSSFIMSSMSEVADTDAV